MEFRILGGNGSEDVKLEFWCQWSIWGHILTSIRIFWAPHMLVRRSVQLLRVTNSHKNEIKKESELHKRYMLPLFVLKQWHYVLSWYTLIVGVLDKTSKLGYLSNMSLYIQDASSQQRHFIDALLLLILWYL